jgi:tripartite-type tricarboxylate transporter receptor subunit TctC
MLAQRLSQSLGQQVVVDNRPGGAGNIGHDIAARAIPDGYTILWCSIGPMVINVGLFPNLPYHPLRDFEPVTLAADSEAVFATLPTALPHIKTGKIRALGVVTAKRAPALPDVPTIAEAGLPGYEASNWYGLAAPARTPKPLVTRLNHEIVTALESPEVREGFANRGLVTVTSTQEQFRAFIGKELDKWSKVIKKIGLKPE